jgi:hypothetical protein
MDKQGQPKKIQTLVIVLVLAATLAATLMIVSNVFDISLAYATTAADPFWNYQWNEQPDCYAFCNNYQNRTSTE